jgi:hypothetical protein
MVDQRHEVDMLHATRLYTHTAVLVKALSGCLFAASWQHQSPNLWLCAAHALVSVCVQVEGQPTINCKGLTISHFSLVQVEALEQVERAFVHVDYQRRDLPEHKVERALLLAPERSSSNGASSSCGGAPPAPGAAGASLPSPLGSAERLVRGDSS